MSILSEILHIYHFSSLISWLRFIVDATILIYNPWSNGIGSSIIIQSILTGCIELWYIIRSAYILLLAWLSSFILDIGGSLLGESVSRHRCCNAERCWGCVIYSTQRILLAILLNRLNVLFIGSCSGCLIILGIQLAWLLSRRTSCDLRRRLLSVCSNSRTLNSILLKSHLQLDIIRFILILFLWALRGSLQALPDLHQGCLTLSLLEARWLRFNRVWGLWTHVLTLLLRYSRWSSYSCWLELDWSIDLHSWQAIWILPLFNVPEHLSLPRVNTWKVKRCSNLAQTQFSNYYWFSFWFVWRYVQCKCQAIDDHLLDFRLCFNFLSLTQVRDQGGT